MTSWLDLTPSHLCVLSRLERHGCYSAPEALCKYLLGSGLRPELGDDLIAIPSSALTTPGVGTIALINPVARGTGHDETSVCYLS